jgi:hypothetical protein
MGMKGQAVMAVLGDMVVVLAGLSNRVYMDYSRR